MPAQNSNTQDLNNGKPRLTLAAWAVGLVIGALVMASCSSTPAATPTPSLTEREVIGVLASYLHAKPLADRRCADNLLGPSSAPLEWSATREDVGVWSVTLESNMLYGGGRRQSSWEYFERTGAIIPDFGNWLRC